MLQLNRRFSDELTAIDIFLFFRIVIGITHYNMETSLMTSVFYASCQIGKKGWRCRVREAQSF